MSRILVLCMVWVLALLPDIYSARAQSSVGDQIENIALIHYTQNGQSVRRQTNPARFTVVARPSDSAIRFYRYAPGFNTARQITLSQTHYQLAANPGAAFIPLGRPETLTGAQIDLSQPVPIVQVENYLVHDLVIIGVEDPGHNLNPDVAETLYVTLHVGGAQATRLKLTENGSNSGDFYGYIPIKPSVGSGREYSLHIAEGHALTGVYADRYNRQDVSTNSIFIRGNGRIFNALTQAPVSGAKVSIFHTETGAPAAVFGLDTKATFPSEVWTGAPVRDSSGHLHEMQPGEFLFPFLKRGRYTVQVEPPEGYIFPSLMPTPSKPGKAKGAHKSDDDNKGLTFELVHNGALSVDLAVDPSADLIVEKLADRDTAAIGDFVSYSVNVTNRGETDAYVRLRDIAPPGFRIEEAFLKTDTGPKPLVFTQMDARTIDFDLGRLAVGGAHRLGYVMRILPGARTGRQTNRIFQISANQKISSKIAQADVFVHEDLLRNTGTITGTLVDGTCTPDTTQAAALKGLSGVQIYLETGDYVTTDARGKFHFQNVRPGTHIVQVDDHTLPQDYALVLCQPSSRAAGSSRARFVELTGGAIHQLRFTAQRLARPVLDGSEVSAPLEDHALRSDPAATSVQTKPSGAKTIAYETDTLGWLNHQDNTTAWVYPDESHVLATPSLDLGIRHGASLRAQLRINGGNADGHKFHERVLSSDAERVLSRWTNVDLQEGENRIEVILQDHSGQTVERLTRTVTYTARIARVEYLPHHSTPVADGKTPPILALKLMDEGGRPVHPGRIVGVDIAPPYRLYQENRLDDSLGLSTSLAALGGITIGEGGVAEVKLDPTYLSGTVNLSIGLETGRTEQISAFLVASQRPWIVVGLAEGTLGQGANPGSRTSDTPLLKDTEPYADGRFAMYAKGNLGDEWNLTLGIDTDKRRGQADSDFNLNVDPTASYTQYGDSSFQQQAAPSRYPVFAKLEKDQFQATFGDFQTGLIHTELARYARQLSGIQIRHSSEHYGVSVFAAETSQRFQRSEQAADGTSGPYTIAPHPIIVQSERIRIETRNRFRPDRVLTTQTLIRYVDYDIDYYTGEVIFSAPVATSDSDFNPNVLVFEYEIQGAGRQDLTAGGRGELHLLDGALNLGASLIQQGANGPDQTEADILAGLDLRYRLADSTLLRAEYASTEWGQASLPGDAPIQDALLLELNHQSRRGSVLAYFREQNTGFGLGQYSQATEDVRRYGVSAVGQLGHQDNAKTGERSFRSVQIEAYNETHLTTENARTVARLNFTQSAPSLNWDSGITYAKEEYAGQPGRDSLLLSHGVRKQFYESGLTLLARHEHPLNDADQVATFPQRSVLGLDKVLTPGATLNLRHEISTGQNVSGQISRAGLTLEPWTGNTVRSALEHTQSEARDQLSANFGLDQSFVIDQNWSAGFGFAQRFDLDPADEVRGTIPNLPLAPVGATASVSRFGSEMFQSGYAGAAYRTPAVFASGRGEFRRTDSGTRATLAVSGARHMSDALTFAGMVRYMQYRQEDAPNSAQIDARLGLAYRPDNDAFILYNRLDLSADTRLAEQESWKFINNLSAYTSLSEQAELSVFLGTKYAETTLLDNQYAGWTHLLGTDLRYAFHPRWDLGLSGSVLYAEGGKAADYGFGASLGFSPQDNLWLALGYNFDGLRDQDFEASHWSRSGPFVKLRLRFDEDTVEAALDRVFRAAR